MPFHIELPETFTAKLAKSSAPLLGLWAAGASTVCAEIVAGSGCDWVLIDAEHSPNTPGTVIEQLHAISAYGAVPVVRPPVADEVLVKRYLDAGVQNLLLPMVDTQELAEEMAAAMHYPPRGTRGVGAALARSSRWNRVPDYLRRASGTVSLTVQIESREGVENVEKIAAVTGVDALFVGPSDLSASLGVLGQQEHPDVVAGIERSIKAGQAVGKPVGVNAFAPEAAANYMRMGASFVSVGADVALLARASEQTVQRFRALSGADVRQSERVATPPSY